MKRPGQADPAQHQNMSGGWVLFHAVVSERMRAASVGSVRSALM